MPPDVQYSESRVNDVNCAKIILAQCKPKYCVYVWHTCVSENCIKSSIWTLAIKGGHMVEKHGSVMLAQYWDVRKLHTPFLSLYSSISFTSLDNVLKLLASYPAGNQNRVCRHKVTRWPLLCRRTFHLCQSSEVTWINQLSQKEWEDGIDDHSSECSHIDARCLPRLGNPGYIITHNIFGWECVASPENPYPSQTTIYDFPYPISDLILKMYTLLQWHCMGHHDAPKIVHFFFPMQCLRWHVTGKIAPRTKQTRHLPYFKAKR